MLIGEEHEKKRKAMFEQTTREVVGMTRLVNISTEKDILGEYWSWRACCQGGIAATDLGKEDFNVGLLHEFGLDRKKVDEYQWKGEQESLFYSAGR